MPFVVPSIGGGVQNDSLLFKEVVKHDLNILDPLHPIEPFVVEDAEFVHILDARVGGQCLGEYLLIGLLVGGPDERHDVVGFVGDDTLDFELHVRNGFKRLVKRSVTHSNAATTIFRARLAANNSLANSVSPTKRSPNGSGARIEGLLVRR